MRILIAPDKFKGSLSAREVAENIAKGLRDILPNAKIDLVPVADGGEGTAEVICEALQGSSIRCKAHDPLGREIECHYAIIEKRKLAVMEMSEAAGMKRLHAELRDVDRANTFGVGEMILDAAQRGAEEIIIGLGGSATNDGGFGMARALGFRFYDGKERPPSAGSRVVREKDRSATPHPFDCRSGEALNPRPLRRGEGRLRSRDLELAGTVTQLRALVRIECPTNLSLPKIIAAADVRNPLLGKNGATRVFGPQKGVTPEKIDMLERALTRLADVVTKEFDFDYRKEAGAGAAGGLGFGLMSFCGATIRAGFDVVAEAVELESKIKDVDVVITGEGSLDAQTLEGKTPAGVARLTRKFGKSVFAIVGRASKDREVRELFDGVYALAERGVSEQESVARAAKLLRERAKGLAKKL
jgi:glycerate 2-kinase